MENWDETKEKLKQKIFRLTDNNVLFIKEQQETILARLEVKLGETREVILKIISRL